MLETNATYTATVRSKSGSFLPESIQMELMELLTQFKKGYFKIGDIAAMCIDAFATDGHSVNNQEVFNEIGKFCGKSGRTVRYYYETAIFYPPEIRAVYDVLPFSHFVLARSFGDWQRVLDFALEHPYMGEDQLRNQFIGVPPYISDYLQGTDATDADGMQSFVETAGPNERFVSRHKYLQAVSNMREGVRVIKELVNTIMDEEERQSYTDLLYILEPAIDYLPKVIEKVTKL